MFLHTPLRDIAELGLFVRSTKLLAEGTPVALRFSHAGELPFSVSGLVQWVNPVRPFSANRNPSMGVTLLSLTIPERKQLLELVPALAFVRDDLN